MNAITVLGLVAGTLTTLAFLPQAWKTWRSKSAGDLSLGTFSLFCTGVSLWLLYGLLTQDLPIILSNIVTLALALTVLFFILRYRRRGPGLPPVGGAGEAKRSEREAKQG